jgi:hypothetical protein
MCCTPNTPTLNSPSTPSGAGAASKITSLSWSRILEAGTASDAAIAKLAGVAAAEVAANPSLYKRVCAVPALDNSFYVFQAIPKGTAGLVANFNGVRKSLPVDLDIAYDFTPLHAATPLNTFTVTLTVRSPFARQVTIPLRLVDVLRDPASGAILRAGNYELQPTALTGPDAEFIKCILACGGLAVLLCLAECLPLLPVPPIPLVFLACMATCLGAGAEEIMLCIEACHASGIMDPTV